MSSGVTIAVIGGLMFGVAFAGPPTNKVDRTAIEAKRSRCKRDCASESGTDRVTCELVCDTQAENDLEGPKIQSWKTKKKMGPAAGTFSIDLKAAFDLGDLIVDDDWIDITFNRHGRPFHTMRGLVRDFQVTEEVASGGVTSLKYTISGDEWPIIFQRTPVWFNRFSAENAGSGLTIKLFDALNVAGPPDETVSTLLFGFLETLAGLGRANWDMPPGTPGRREDIIDAFAYNTKDFGGDPARIAISTQFMNPNGTDIWNLAKEWSDPMFCELWCDLGDKNSNLGFGGDTIEAGKSITPDDTIMTIFFRDRPFPTTQKGSDSRWFTLPMLEIPPTHISRKDVGRSGLERFNAYFVSPQVIQSLAGRFDLQSPLWDKDDIRRHGLRKFEVQSRYLTDNNNLFAMSQEQRLLIRDWHCLNPYLLNGTISLGRLYPDLRLGMRLRITGEDEETQETYYVEEVNHTWMLTQGGRTTAGVTRGYKGPDRDYLQRLQEQVARYELITQRGRVAPPDFGFA